MSLGWRPHDLERSYLPFGHGVGTQVGSSDPVFMARLGRKPIADEIPEFPYDAVTKQKLLVDGDPTAKDAAQLGYAWLAEANFGFYRSWEDVKPLRDNWEGPLILKGIQHVEVRDFHHSIFGTLNDFSFSRMLRKLLISE